MSLSNAFEGTSARAAGLSWLLEGVDVDTFLGSYLGEEMLHVPGAASRVSKLFSWDELNALLNRDTTTGEQVRLVKRGRLIEREDYTRTYGGEKSLDAARCQQHMASGATLIVQIPERINPELEALMTALRRDLEGEAYVDVVATSVSVPGLNLHWDPYECFNIQIAGEKEWSVTRPTHAYPLRATKFFPMRGDLVEPAPPDGPPTWSGIMRPGDVIYLPRGWWHGVTPRTLPSMHLSIAVDHPTFSDFLASFAHASKRHDLARRPMPSWETEDKRQEFVKKVFALVEETLSPETLAAYMEQTAARRPSKTAFSLPSSAMHLRATLTPATRIQLRRRPLPCRVQDGKMYLEWDGTALEFTDRLVPAVRRLNDQGTCALADLGHGIDALLVRALVLALLSAEAVALSNGPTAQA